MVVICYPGAKVQQKVQSCNFLKEKVEKMSLFVMLSCISQGEDAYCCGFVGTMQGEGAAAECGTCRHHIIDNDEVFASPLVGDRGLVDTFGVLSSGFAFEPRLRLSVLRAPDEIHHWQSSHFRHAPCQHLCLVIASLPSPPSGQWHRHQRIDSLPKALPFCFQRCPLAQLGGEVALAVEFDADDEVVVGRMVVVGEERRGLPHVGLVPDHAKQRIVVDVYDAIARQSDGAEGTEHILARHQQLPAHRAGAWQQEFLQVSE